MQEAMLEHVLADPNVAAQVAVAVEQGAAPAQGYQQREGGEDQVGQEGAGRRSRIWFGSSINATGFWRGRRVGELPRLR